MSLTANTISALNHYGFPTTAEFVRQVQVAGIEDVEGNEHKYGATLRGLSHWFCDPITREEIKRAIKNNTFYRINDSRNFFSRNGGTPHGKAVNELVLRSSLANVPLKVLDAACNHGYLVEKLTPKVERYIGIDLIEETIRSANEQAKERFARAECSNYQFVAGNILLRSAFERLPKDNNLIVCTGTLGHFRPAQIVKLLNNFSFVLSGDANSRIIISCPIIPKDYDSTGLVVNCDGWGNVLPKPRREEDGVRFIIQRNVSKSGVAKFEYRRYELDDFTSLIETQTPFKVEDSVKPEDSQNIYVSLISNNK